ncbi:MAG TPA: hypothetical protein VFO46_07195 [Candidatus Sulfotelmatobacter sp.]|nr:hypothetical protein [Candidatus Sulfotelmatobacter sp.]
MKKGQAKSVVERVENLAEKRKHSIQLKCHPVLFELAQLWKESIIEFKRLGPNAPKERLAELEQKFEKRLQESHRKYSGPNPPAPNTFAAQTIFRNEENMSDADGIADWIHFDRHKIPLKQDLQRRQNRDWGSTSRVLRTANDMEQLRCGKPIRPFKGNLEHQNMFESFWGLGIEKLTPEELADFFDQFCPCGNEGHDPDALKKHRSRFARSIAPSPNPK